jgi:hypothetical protein
VAALAGPIAPLQSWDALSRSLKECSVSDVIGVAIFIVCAFVPLWTARAILTILLNLMAKTDLQH